MENFDEETGECRSRRKITASHWKEKRAMEERQRRELQKCTEKSAKKILQDNHKQQLEALAVKHASDLQESGFYPPLPPSSSAQRGEQNDKFPESKDTEGAISSVALFCCSQSKNISKSQKKRVKKQKRLQEELDKMEANRSEDSYLAKRETEHIENILWQEHLLLHQIQSDGHCMFRAIEHQLKLMNRDVPNYLELRKLAACYLLEKKTEFEPFFHGYQQDDTNQRDTTSFEDHCRDIRESSAWGYVYHSRPEQGLSSMAVDSFSTVTLMEGPLRRVNVARNTIGELELNALSKCLGYDIEVYQSGSGKIVYSSGLSDVTRLIRLAFHRYQYSSGSACFERCYGPDIESTEIQKQAS